MRSRTLSLCALLLAVPLAAAAGEPVDLNVVTRIRDEGLNHSQVMDTARVLTDEIGPRLTNSPAYRHAARWARDRLAEWGLANAHLEGFEFGRGWTYSRVAARLVKPYEASFSAWPMAWTPATDGAVRGPVMRISLKSAEDLEKYRGTLAGKIVLVDEPRELEPAEEPLFDRYAADELDKLVEFPIRGGRRSEWRKRYMKQRQLREKSAAFLAEEGVLAAFMVSSRDGGLVRVTGSRAYKEGKPEGVATLVLAAEHYNRLTRLLDNDVEVEVEVDVAARFLDDDLTTHNVIAEIPGSDLADEVVMAGAHLDSWHAGTGATDDAAGCAVVMEAVRILEAIGVEPRRTIRVALWASEEQGLNGSRAYVKEHLAFRPEPDDPKQRELPEWAREDRRPLQFKPGWAKLSAYFNLDNGSGRIRGIYAQENAAVAPIFAAWLEPFHDLGADTVTLRNTGGTDHLSFDAVGLPGFQFIQDRLDYMTRTHHTHMDVYDRLQREDLMQAAVVMASFLYHAAMRDEMLPRKPPPRERRSGHGNDH